jgi:hypothetical protein
MTIRLSFASGRKRPTPAKAHGGSGTARGARAGQSAKRHGPREPKTTISQQRSRNLAADKIPEFPESGGQSNGGQPERPREKEIPEFPETGGQSNGGQPERPRDKENPEFPETGGQSNGGQPANPALELINADLRKFIHSGAVVARWRHARGNKLGPYYHFRYREHGRVREVYLGREGPPVQAVRDRLAELHQALARHRMIDREMQRMRRLLRADRAAMKQHLANAGLRMHGNEIRGWRKRLDPIQYPPETASGTIFLTKSPRPT